MSFEIINPESLGEPKGWNNGLLAPPGARVLFVAGQSARDREGRIVDGGFAAQFERALENVLAVVEAAGGRPEQIGRMTIFVSDLEAYLSSRKELGTVWRRHMGRHYPALGLFEVSRLVDEGALVEIEATAVV